MLSGKLAHLVEVFVVEGGLLKGSGHEARDVEGSTGGGSVRCTHGCSAHTAGTKAVEERSTVTGMMSGGHGVNSRRVRW